MHIRQALEKSVQRNRYWICSGTLPSYSLSSREMKYKCDGELLSTCKWHVCATHNEDLMPFLSGSSMLISVSFSITSLGYHRREGIFRMTCGEVSPAMRRGQCPIYHACIRTQRDVSPIHWQFASAYATMR